MQCQRLGAILVVLPAFVIIAKACGAERAPESASVGWQVASPREEIRPAFAFDPGGGPAGRGSFVVRADAREGLDGYWHKTFPVTGGRHYQFTVRRRTHDVETPRRSAVVKLTWQDDEGRLVPGGAGKSRPEYPSDGPTDAKGWSEVADTYLVPAKATRALVELHLRWAAGGTVEWSGVTLQETSKPAERRVRLAAVHFQPRGGKTPAGNRRLFEPLIAEAARQRADLLCLPESLTMYGNGHSYVQAAEPIPGPSTEYFGGLAREHDLYIVAGLLERSGHLVYNAAVLLAPDGSIVGKYRKVCLPREEIKGGVAPGHDYPVFDTRFGKLGMMVCWDVHFPEVCRNLANRGAEVVAMPIWGGNPALARARAIENQIHLVTSTYTSGEDWMRTGVIDPEGNWIALASEWGTVVVAEVDLNHRKQWKFLGDFRARISRECPVAGFTE